MNFLHQGFRKLSYYTHTTDRRTYRCERNYYHATLWLIYLLPRNFVASIFITTSLCGWYIYYHATLWLVHSLPHHFVADIFITTQLCGYYIHYHVTLWLVYLLPCHSVGGNEVQTVKVMKSHRELTGCMYCAGMPTAFTRPDCAATVLALAPAPDDFRRFDRGLCVRPAGRNSACGSCSFGSIIGGGCSSILLSCDQHEVQLL